MDVSVADAACMHLHQHLIGSGLRLRNVFDLPRTAHSRNDCSFHTLPPSVIRCERLGGRCMILDAGAHSHTIALIKAIDRKSTRLNSSHSQISYAVFCLKKKKKKNVIFSFLQKKKKTKYH